MSKPPGLRRERCQRLALQPPSPATPRTGDGQRRKTLKPLQKPLKLSLQTPSPFAKRIQLFGQTTKILRQTIELFWQTHEPFRQRLLGQGKRIEMKAA